MSEYIDEALKRLAESVREPVGGTVMLSKADACALGTSIESLRQQLAAAIAERTIVLDACQLRHAAEFAAPDYDQDESQRGTELVFQQLPERVVDGETMPAGMYCWYLEYPEEGVLYLPDFTTLTTRTAMNAAIAAGGEETGS